MSTNESNSDYYSEQSLQNSKQYITEENKNPSLFLQYGPNDIPEWYKAIPFGFQVKSNNF
jgi:hypothetical protein